MTVGCFLVFDSRKLENKLNW